MNQPKETTVKESEPKTVASSSMTIDPCDKAHDAEQSRNSDEDEACFDSVR